MYYGAESLLPLYFWMPVFSRISEKLPVFHSVNVIVSMCSDNDTVLTVMTKSEDCSHSSDHIQTHYTLYLMKTFVTTKALETMEEIVNCLKTFFQSDFSCFIKAVEMKRCVCALLGLLCIRV